MIDFNVLCLLKLFQMNAMSGLTVLDILDALGFGLSKWSATMETIKYLTIEFDRPHLENMIEEFMFAPDSEWIPVISRLHEIYSVRYPSDESEWSLNINKTL